MAIMDERTKFCEDFDLDQEAGTYLATNQVDLGGAGRDPGNGQVVYLNMVVTETFTDGGDSATLDVRLVSDDTASIHASTSSVHFQSGTILKAALAAGERFSWPVPVEGTPYERYLGINFVVGTAGFDAGMVTAWLSLDPIGWKAYPDATN